MCSAPPGPIVNPSVTDTTHSTISLAWAAPANDGGSPVIGYLVECKRVNTADWIRCNIPRNLQETSYVIQNLIDKNEYQCRITAVNKVGFSEPVEVPGKHVAKDIIGMNTFLRFKCNKELLFFFFFKSLQDFDCTSQYKFLFFGR